MREDGTLRLPGIALAAPLALALLAAAPAAGEPTTVVDVVDVPAEGSHEGSAICPAGSNALGGGAGPGNALTMDVTVTAPVLEAGFVHNLAADSYDAPYGWSAAARSTHTSHRSLATSAVCLDAPAETVVFQNTILGGVRGPGKVPCPDGKVAVSGGVDVDHIDSMPVVTSAPVLGPDHLQNLADLEPGTHGPPTAWRGVVRNDGEDGEDSAAYGIAAVCTSALSVETVVVEATAAADSHGTPQVLCPEGSYAVGGGIEPVTESDVTVSRLTPLLGDRDDPTLPLIEGEGSYPEAPVGWEAGLVNTSSSESRTFKVAAICVPEPSRRALAAGALAGLAVLAAARRRAGAPGRSA